MTARSKRNHERAELRVTGSVARALAWCWIGACVGCAAPREDPREHAPEAAQQRVTLTAVARTRVPQIVAVTGILSAEDSVVVSAKVPGRLAALAVDLGSRVKKGDVLAQVESVDYALRVQQAEALVLAAKASLGIRPDSHDERVFEERAPDVVAARATRDESARQLERVQQLVAKKLVGAADLDTARATAARADAQLGAKQQEVWARIAVLKQRQSELALARQALADTTVRAPISGAVRERSTSVGALLAVGAPLVALVQVDPMRLRVSVPERVAQHVAVGQVLHVIDDHGQHVADGRLARVSPILSADTRNLDVEADIPAAAGLLPGAFVRANIVTTAETDVLSVPASAVVVFAGLHKVLQIADGKVREVPVEIGETHEGRTAISAGLDEGSLVIVEPKRLQNGDSVSPVAEGPRAEAR